jgi:hypothetical protein
MHAERAGEGFDGGEEPLLQSGDQKTGGGLRPSRGVLQSLLTEFAVLVEQCGQLQLGGIFREGVDVHLHDVPFGEAPLDVADVLLEPPDDDLIAVFGRDGDPTAEPLRVEDFKECREAVRVPVVRRRRQEQPMLEPGSQVTHRTGNLRVDGIALATRWGSMVSFIQDEQRTTAERSQPVAQWPNIRFIDE